MRPARPRPYPRRWAGPLLAMIVGACAGPVVPSQAEPPLEDGWAFSYDDRERASTSPIDLRKLNEAVAGQSGFVRLSPDGNELRARRRDARAILGRRLGAVQVQAIVRGDPAARPVPRQDGREPGPAPRPDLLEGAELEASPTSTRRRSTASGDSSPRPRNRGSTSPSRPTGPTERGHDPLGDRGATSLPANSGASSSSTRPSRKVIRPGPPPSTARPNPYTKIPLAKDPSVAIIQVQNEDSLLFWTNMPDEARPEDAKFASEVSPSGPSPRSTARSRPPKKAWEGNIAQGRRLRQAGKVEPGRHLLR